MGVLIGATIFGVAGAQSPETAPTQEATPTPWACPGHTEEMAAQMGDMTAHMQDMQGHMQDMGVHMEGVDHGAMMGGAGGMMGGGMMDGAGSASPITPAPNPSGVSNTKSTSTGVAGRMMNGSSGGMGGGMMGGGMMGR